MKIVDLLPIERIKLPLEGKSKEDIIKELVDLIANSTEDFNEKVVYEEVWKREKTMSTGVGSGIAIPHCKTSSVDKITASFGIMPEGVDFESLDSEPSYIFFMLVSPESPTGPHLRCLSRISRILNNAEFREKLKNADSAESALNLIDLEEKKYFEIR